MATSGPSMRPSLRILVVDDNVDSAKTTAALLRRDGHEAHAVHRGWDALAAAAAQRPDLVLLDLSLPDIDGCEVVRRLRAEPWSHAMTLVALTGWARDEDRFVAYAAGFDDYLVKPVDTPPLLRMLGRVAARRPVRMT